MPGTIVAGPVCVTAKSACGEIALVTDAELLVAFRSVVAAVR